MGEAIGDVLSFGVGVALSPVPIIAVVFMLGTSRARSNGLAFLVGWLAGLLVVGTLVLLLASGVDPSDEGEPATWVSVVEIVLGTLLLLVAVRLWRGRPAPGEDSELPKWMQAIDTFTPGRSAAMAAALSGVNPKNLILTVGAAAAIAKTGIDTGQQFVALVVFALIGTIGPGIPVAIYFAMGDRAPRVLSDLKTWLGAHNTAIMTVLCAVIAAKLVGAGVAGLSG
jgi:threonine/homoserine/homoserine lactone efflux protein